MTDKLAKVESSSLARPSYLTNYEKAEGVDHISPDDLRVPRLAIAQGLSKQLDPTEPVFIDGLKQLQLFNDVTGQIYGEGPIDIAIIRADKPRGMEFRSRKDGGGVVDFDVPLDDPRMQFTTDPDTGERKRPIGTKFYDYIVVMIPSFEIIALSMKDTSIKVAKQLNALILLRNAPIYCGRYTLGTAREKNNQGTYGIYTIENSKNVDAFTPTDENGNPDPKLSGWLNEKTVHYMKKLYDTWKGKEINIERVADEEGLDTDEGADIPF